MKFKIFSRPVGKLSRYPYGLHQMVKIFFLHPTDLGDYGRNKHVIQGRRFFPFIKKLVTGLAEIHLLSHLNPSFLQYDAKATHEAFGKRLYSTVP